MHNDNLFQRIALPLSIILLCLMLATRSGHSQTFQPTRFTVVDAGATGKPDVLLLPGLSSSRTVWDAEAKLLAPNYRLHLVQINGFGGASAGVNATGTLLPAITEELHGYINASKMKPVVVGHSLGGLLALMLADKHPADVRKLVIVDSLPFYGVLFNANATPESLKPQLNAMADAMRTMPADQIAASNTMTAAALVKDPAAQKLVAADSAASDRSVLIEAMIEDMGTDLRADVAGIKVPTLVLYPFEQGRQGADSSAVDAVYTTAYKAMVNVQMARVDGSRHFIMYDQPAVFAAALETFLK